MGAESGEAEAGRRGIGKRRRAGGSRARPSAASAGPRRGSPGSGHRPEPAEQARIVVAPRPASRARRSARAGRRPGAGTGGRRGSAAHRATAGPRPAPAPAGGPRPRRPAPVVARSRRLSRPSGLRQRAQLLEDLHVLAPGARRVLEKRPADDALPVDQHVRPVREELVLEQRAVAPAHVALEVAQEVDRDVLLLP